MGELVGKSIRELNELISSKHVSARQVVQAHYAHIEKTEAELGAFLTLTPDLAYACADAVDREIAAGKRPGPLAGIPAAVKDNICVAAHPTTCASKILANFTPPYDATVVTRLKQAGAAVMGKTNLDEFAMGSSTENSGVKRTRNPWDAKVVPGGSSGGSACAVAAGQAVFALGSDTGGSIRQPASFCGIVGMKPTYGLVSRFGLVAFASSLDQIGPMGRSVDDVAFVMSAICGHDSKDSTSLSGESPDFTRSLAESIAGVRIGIIEELCGQGIDSEVQQAVEAAAAVFCRLGAVVETVSLPNSSHALPVYYLIATAEASANLARYDGVRYGHRAEGAADITELYGKTRDQGFGSEVKRRIMLGTYALSSGYYDAYYRKAQQVRRLVKEDYERAFAVYDLLMCPTAPSPAFAFEAKTGDPLKMYLSDIATIPANLAGLPGISIPCGFSATGLPVGLQLIGPALKDAELLRAASAFERSTEFHKKGSPVLPSAKVC